MAPTGAAVVSVQVSAKRAADSVIQALEERIRTGELKDGEPLPSERDMMDEFYISRTVAREAVQALSNRGLVEARPRFRPVVRKPGYDAAMHAVGSVVAHLLEQPGGIKNLFDTRILVEAALVRQAALHAGKDDIAALRRALEENCAAIGDWERFWDTDLTFHGVLYGITGNPVLPAIHKAYLAWLSPYWRKPSPSEHNQATYWEHEGIFEAILMRDPDAAEEQLRSHLSGCFWATPLFAEDARSADSTPPRGRPR